MTDTDLATTRHGCSQCGLHEVCLPAGVDSRTMARLDRITRDRRVLVRGEPLFRQGQAFSAIYVLRSGAIRRTIGDAEGGHQVIGFSLPGEVLGLDGLLEDGYRTEAIALERSTLCELPFAVMEEVMSQVPTLQRTVMRVLGSEVAADQDHLVAMGRQQAVERVALFVHGMVERQGRLSRQSDFLKLPMSRSDIANYLGLAVETVSRALGRMAQDGILISSGRSLRILDRAALTARCGVYTPCDRVKN